MKIEQLLFEPSEGQTILEPEGKEPGYWIGVPAIYYDESTQTYFLYVRVRNPRPESGKITPTDTHRGYKCQIMESEDGINFKPIWEMRKNQIGARSIEGGALMKIEDQFHLFQSFELPGLIPRWKIKKMVADHPSEFTPESLEKIDWDVPFRYRLSIKDPLIYYHNGDYYLYIDYFRFWKRPFGSTGVLFSKDGLKFKWVDDIFYRPKKCSWLKQYMRLTSIFKVEDKIFGFVDGTDKQSGICEEKAGIIKGTSHYKFRVWSCDKPSYSSEYGKGSVRYIFALKEQNRLRLYYEYTEKEGQHVLKNKEIVL